MSHSTFKFQLTLGHPLGGWFTTVNGSTARNRLAALDTTTGIATSFNPNMSSAVHALAISGTTLYAGGQFTTVNGSTTRNNLAALDTTTGIATSFNPNMSSTVRALAISGTTLYAGGVFTTVNGSTARNRLASLRNFGKLWMVEKRNIAA